MFHVSQFQFDNNRIQNDKYKLYHYLDRTTKRFHAPPKHGNQTAGDRKKLVVEQSLIEGNIGLQSQGSSFEFSINTCVFRFSGQGLFAIRKAWFTSYHRPFLYMLVSAFTFKPDYPVAPFYLALFPCTAFLVLLVDLPQQFYLSRA
jgi:hypothetical protein